LAVPETVRKEVHLLPSILSADFSRLGEEVGRVMDAGIRIIHVDIMDGHFVPNITVGPLVLEALAPEVHRRNGFFSVHLMIQCPERFVERFAGAGADAMSIHVESTSHAYRTLGAIRDLGVSPGLALNPGTDVSRLLGLVESIDFALVMTVNPGFGGQRLIPGAAETIPALRRMLPPGVALEVDGGVKRENIRDLVEKGANWVVTGSALFGADDPAAEARALRDLMVGRALM
jgi:ribulose-phosphate 3-epimerase